MEHVDLEPFDGKMKQKLIEGCLSNSAILTTMGNMDFVERTFFRPINMRLHDLSPERYAVSKRFPRVRSVLESRSAPVFTWGH